MAFCSDSIFRHRPCSGCGGIEQRSLHGAPSATLRGFEFPVFTWLQEQAPTHTLHFVVIDQGERRFCFRVRRRRQSGPL
ncbi:hypothetical protein QLQ15_09755 [Lysobacter sp. LF1]|uniref:Uncharacterized protein n=1 Tax=Lysobacter stagni TaxID=3045172 RepID=A0ABT6XHD9_9GAMM|nr:hypothetical protein [Lysobacter sp. LF1]MDI9239195.1 hypothetical protein [Lysobacter sp. LF1]